MSATSSPEPATLLARIDLRVPGSGQRGHAYLPTSLLPTIDVEELAAHLGRVFVEEDEEPRLRLLEQALARPAITVETYPGETAPVELHAYVRAPEVSDAPIFACVLATPAVVEHLVSMPPHLVLETSTFQVIGDDASPAAIRAGFETWAGRVWPDAKPPRIVVEQWPDLEGLDLWPAGLLNPSPRLRLTSDPVRGAPLALSARDFPRPEELRQL